MMKFIDLTHTYINEEKNIPYESVTTFLNKFKPHKDWKKIAENYAKKHNMKVEDVLKKWDDEKNKGTTRGSKIHGIKESQDLALNYSVIFKGTDKEKELPVIPSLLKDGIKRSVTPKLEEGVYPELMIWLDSILLAGQADKIIIENDTIHVLDYKTNKNISMKGFKSWDGVIEKLKQPVAHLDMCDFSIYSLQLNMYAFMIKRNNPKFKIGKMILRHILFDENENIIDEKDYIIPNLQKECKDLYNYRLKELKSLKSLKN